MINLAMILHTIEFLSNRSSKLQSDSYARINTTCVSIYIDGMCIKSLVMLLSWLAAMCFLWALPSILQKMASNRTIYRDERDAAICRSSALTAHAVSWLYFLAACLVSAAVRIDGHSSACVARVSR